METPADIVDEKIGNIGDLIQAVRAISAVDSLVTQTKADQAEMNRWYAARIESITARKEWMEGKIAGYLEFEQKNSVATPAGTAMLRTHDTWNWPSDDDLVAWAKTIVNAEEPLLKTVEVPQKSVIKKLMREGKLGDPPGLTKSPHTSIVISKRGVSDDIPTISVEATGVTGASASIAA